MTVQAALNCWDRRLMELPRAAIIPGYELSKTRLQEHLVESGLKNICAYKEIVVQTFFETDKQVWISKTESYEVENLTLDWRESRRSSNSLSTIGVDRQTCHEKAVRPQTNFGHNVSTTSSRHHHNTRRKTPLEEDAKELGQKSSTLKQKLLGDLTSKKNN